MKIIDFDEKGNVIRFYLGDDNCEDYWGDDWNDRGCTDRVYGEFIKGWIDVCYPYDYDVLDPFNDWNYGNNSPFSKDDLKHGKTACIIAIKSDEEDGWSVNFTEYVGDMRSDKFYFNDPVEKIEQCKHLTVLERWDR